MKRMWPFLLIVSLAGLGFGFGVPKTPSSARQGTELSGLPALLFVAAPEIHSGPLAGRFPRGSHLVRYVPGTPSASAENVTPAFYAAADPEISFDAKKVLFAGQKTRRDHWQVWEMKVDGSDLRQITHCAGECFEPAYLPHGEIAYTVVAGKKGRQSSAIYVSQLNGADAHPITFGPGDYRLETVLKSGRLLVSARATLTAGGKGNGSRVFYMMRPDGSGMFQLRGNSRPGYVRTGATELENGTVLFVKHRDPHGSITGGELAWVKPGALHNSVITPGAADYWSAHVLDGNKLVVARKATGASAGNAKYALYTFHLADKSAGREIYSNPKFSSVEAVPVEARKVPLSFPSMLHPNRDYGRIICLNSYLSAGAPGGHLPSHIAKVRVIALGADGHTERVLGEAAVESDGSFYIKVPADRPIRFALVGKNGSVIRAQKSWVWARNGEDAACLGCHENPAEVPQDRFPMALESSNTPISIGLPASSQPQKH